MTLNTCCHNLTLIIYSSYFEKENLFNLQGCEILRLIKKVQSLNAKEVCGTEFTTAMTFDDSYKYI